MGGGGVMGREGLLLASATFIYLFIFFVCLFIYFWPQK